MKMILIPLAMLMVLAIGCTTTGNSKYEFYNMRDNIHETCPTQRTICVGCDMNGNGACAYPEVMRGVNYIVGPHDSSEYKAKYGLSDIEYDEMNERYCVWCDKVQGYKWKVRCIRECNMLINNTNGGD